MHLKKRSRPLKANCMFSSGVSYISSLSHINSLSIKWHPVLYLCCYVPLVLKLFFLLKHCNITRLISTYESISSMADEARQNDINDVTRQKQNEWETHVKACSDNGSASVSFAQKWPFEISFRRRLFTLIFCVLFRACSLLLLLEYYFLHKYLNFYWRKECNHCSSYDSLIFCAAYS